MKLRRTNVGNKYVTSTNREDSAMRYKWTCLPSKFLHQWMKLTAINILKNILDPKLSTELITERRGTVSQMFGLDHVGEFVADLCRSWTKLSKIDSVDIQNMGILYALCLRKMAQASCGRPKSPLQLFLLWPHAAFLTLTRSDVPGFHNDRTYSNFHLRLHIIEIYKYIYIYILSEWWFPACLFDHGSI